MNGVPAAPWRAGTQRAGLYVHIPFCRQKCRYCDFASFAGAENLTEAYLSALDKEASYYAGRDFDTLYIGGGTPSLLSAEQLERLGGLLERHFGPVPAFSESTLEANPESLTPDKLHVLKEAGFNRLSLGLQSFDDATLKRIGRVHDVRTFLTAYENARKAGFDNINVDLIAGLPGQTEQAFSSGLKRLAELAPEHVSVYGLQVEEGTPFYREGVRAEEDLLRNELERAHFMLEEAGFTHYEISNFARPGRESRHNVNYWLNGDYLGLGSCAASYRGGVRRSNVPGLREYLLCMEQGKSPVVFSESLHGKAREGETLMLGLRLLGGIRLSAKQRHYFSAELAELAARGLVEQKADLLKLTFEGMFLANQAFMAFVGPFD